jgi:uncharacterized UBP type Zn finger protein
MDLVCHNSDLELTPGGFINTGFTCYYNSLLQGLLSCTSFSGELLKNKKIYKQYSPLLDCIIDIIEGRFQGRDTSRGGPLSWNAMIHCLQTVFLRDQSRTIQFARGQQCVVEGFNLFVELLEKFPRLHNLFLHRRNITLYCSNCSKWCSDINEMNTFFEVDPQFHIPQSSTLNNAETPASTTAPASSSQSRSLNEFLLNQDSYVDADHICSLCGWRGEKYKKNKLVMIPEILFVMSRKYSFNSNSHQGRKLNIYTDFPKVLTFQARENRVFEYEAVAQIEHSGGLQGGHYWVICRRQNNCWYVMNDNSVSVSAAGFNPGNNTYVVIYHIMKKYNSV